MGAGGRGWSAKSSPPPPHPASSASAATPEANAPMRIRPLMLIPVPPAGTLAEPDGAARSYQPVHLGLDAATDLLGERLHELEVLGVLGRVAVERDGLEEADLELRGQVHQPGERPELRE